jgi:hypothetical protein
MPVKCEKPQPTNVPLKYYILIDCNPLEIKEGDKLVSINKEDPIKGPYTVFKIYNKTDDGGYKYVKGFNSYTHEIEFDPSYKGGRKSRTIRIFREKRRNKSIKINK